jgi:hypothetical protein
MSRFPSVAYGFHEPTGRTHIPWIIADHGMHDDFGVLRPELKCGFSAPLLGLTMRVLPS